MLQSLVSKFPEFKTKVLRARVTEELFDSIKKQAVAHKQSVSKEIVDRLEKSLCSP